MGSAFQTRLLGLATGAVCLSLLTCEACNTASQKFPSINVAWRFAPQPLRVGPTNIQVHITENRKSLTGARVHFEATMTHPGMAPEFGEAREMGAGDYEGKLNLTMEGDWFLMARVELPDGRTLERGTDVPGVAPAQGR